LNGEGPGPASGNSARVSELSPRNIKSRKSNEICFTVFIPWGDALPVPIMYIDKLLDKLPEFSSTSFGRPLMVRIQGKVPEVENVAKLECREFEGRTH